MQTPAELLLEAELLNNSVVALLVITFQILKWVRRSATIWRRPRRSACLCRVSSNVT
jgi:hypothetical protein